MLKEIAILLLVAIIGTIALVSQGNEPVTVFDISFNVFIELLGTALTIFIIEKIWNAEERNKWKTVKDDVTTLITEEIYYVFIDFANILIPPRVVTGINPKEIGKVTHEYRLGELENLVSGALTNIENRLREEEHLLNGDYGNIFRRRYENLSEIEKKWWKFLEPSTSRIIINLERLLKSLQSNINVKLKLEEQNHLQLVPVIEKKIFHRTHAILQKLNESKKIGFLKYQD